MMLRDTQKTLIQPSPLVKSSPICRSICEWIVKALPIAEDNPIWLRLVPPMHIKKAAFTSGPTRSAQLREWLINQCIRRFMVLNNHHHDNAKLNTFGEPDRIYNSTKYIDINRKNLYVLDLDEAILYQRETINPLSSTSEYLDIGKFNSEDLKISIFPYMSELNFVVYRPFLMELLNDNIDNSDFIIYTMASKDCAIHHAITIEVYVLVSPQHF